MGGPPQTASGSTRMIDSPSSPSGPQGPEASLNIFSGRNLSQITPSLPSNASGEGSGVARTSVAGGLRSEDPFSYLDTPTGSSMAMHRSIQAQSSFPPPMSSMQRFAQSTAGPSHTPFRTPFNMPGSFPGSSAFIASVRHRILFTSFFPFNLLI